VTIRHRVAEMTDARAPSFVAPGMAVIRGPSIRAVDRTGPSSGDIDYVIVERAPRRDRMPSATATTASVSASRSRPTVGSRLDSSSAMTRTIPRPDNGERGAGG
jgi:hypothetical protein